MSLWSHIQSKSLWSSTVAPTLSLTFNAPTEAGNMIVLVVGYVSFGRVNAPTITDSAGNTYTPVANAEATGSYYNHLIAYTVLNATSASSLTLSFSNSSNVMACAVAMHEYDVPSTMKVDGTCASQSGGISVTSVANNDLWFAAGMASLVTLGATSWNGLDEMLEHQATSTRDTSTPGSPYWLNYLDADNGLTSASAIGVNNATIGLGTFLDKQLSVSFTMKAYGPISVGSITPTSGYYDGGYSATLSGISGLRTGASIQFGNDPYWVPATHAPYTNGQTVLSITVPPAYLKDYEIWDNPQSVRIVNDDGQAAVLNDVFTFMPRPTTSSSEFIG